MSSLPIDSIANIASFLPLREQVKTFPKFNNCIKKVENKKKLIRRTLYYWRIDYIKRGWISSKKVDFKKYTPLAIRKAIIDTIKSDKYHSQHQEAINGASFNDIIDGLDVCERIRMVTMSISLTRKLHAKA